jgi:hypothetical protein
MIARRIPGDRHFVGIADRAMKRHRSRMIVFPPACYQTSSHTTFYECGVEQRPADAPAGSLPKLLGDAEAPGGRCGPTRPGVERPRPRRPGTRLKRPFAHRFTLVAPGTGTSCRSPRAPQLN